MGNIDQLTKTGNYREALLEINKCISEIGNHPNPRVQVNIESANYQLRKLEAKTRVIENLIKLDSVELQAKAAHQEATESQQQKPATGFSSFFR